jgi:hypothetical protein
MRVGTFDVDVANLHVSRVSHEKDGANPPAPSPNDAPTTELGGSGRSTYYSTIRLAEYVPELKGYKWLKAADKMRRSDAQVRASMLLVKMPVLSADWWIEPYSDDDEDRAVADFVAWCYNNTHRTFESILKESLLALDYGHYVQEPVYEITTYVPPKKWGRPRDVAKWADFAPRHPYTLEEPEYDDDNGRFTGWWHFPGGRKADRKQLPANRILVFTWDEEANDPRGTSILRSAYPHWYYKYHMYKVDAIQKERHGIGIPEIVLPPGAKDEDRNYAHELGRNLRTNESAYVVRPHGWEIGFIEPKGQLTNALESAEHHGAHIAANTLQGFMNSVSESSGKQTEASVDVFVKALRHLASWIAGVHNQFAIPQLVDYNFVVKGYPKLRCRRLGEASDSRAFAVTLRNLVEAEIVTAGPDLERYVRKHVFDLPAEGNDDVDRSSRARIQARRGKNMKGDDDGDATNPNRQDPGNKDKGKSPSGKPTE